MFYAVRIEILEGPW